MRREPTMRGISPIYTGMCRRSGSGRARWFRAAWSRRVAACAVRLPIRTIAATLVVALGSFASVPARALSIAFAASGVPTRDAAGRIVSIAGTLVPTSSETPLYTGTATALPGSVVAIVSAPNQDLRSAPGALLLGTASGALAAVPRTAPTPGLSYEPVATRWVPAPGFIQLPGSHSPWMSDGVLLNPEYDPRIDGCVLAGSGGVAPAGTCAGISLIHPLIGQPWSSEMAAFSWNYLNVLVSFSTPDDDGVIETNELDPANPLRLDGCSLVLPQFCRSVQEAQDLFGLLVTPLPDDPNGSAADWLWNRGVSWEVTEASGDLAPYLGGTLVSYGPFDDGAGGARVALVLVPEPASAGLLLAGLAALNRRARRERARR